MDVMKIVPTKGEYKALRSASEKLETICKTGMECETCFMNERLDGESCCPASHIISIVHPPRISGADHARRGKVVNVSNISHACARNSYNFYTKY